MAFIVSPFVEALILNLVIVVFACGVCFWASRVGTQRKGQKREGEDKNES